MQIVYKNKTKLGNNFHFKDCIPEDLTSGVFISFNADFAMIPIMVNTLEYKTW